MVSMDHAAGSSESREREYGAMLLVLESNERIREWATRRIHMANMPEDDMESLEEAIRLARQAIEMAPDATGLDFYYGTLAAGLELLFSITRTTHSIDEAVDTRRLAVGASVGHTERWAHQLYCLADALSKRYSQKCLPDDLEEAIRADRQAIEVAPDGPDRALYLQHLAHCLTERYSKTRAGRDLEEAVLLGKQAVDLTPERRDKAYYLIKLSEGLSNSAYKTRADIDESISLAKQALDMTPDGLDRASSLRAVAGRLNDRFMQSRNMDDVEQAIVLAEEAVELARDSVERASYFEMLALLLLNSYVRTGRVTDLDRGIALAEEAVEKMADGDDGRKYLRCLAHGLSISYARTGRRSHGERGIQVARQAVQATPENDPEWPTALASYAEHLIDRFRSTRAMSDLDEAILHTRKAVEAMPEAHPLWPRHLAALANQLHMRHMSIDDTTALGEGIRAARKVIAATPDDHPLRAQWFDILSRMLDSQDLATKTQLNLEESIQLLEKAVEATPEDHPDWTTFASELARQRDSKYRMTGDIASMDEAIRLFERAVDVSPSNNPRLAVLLFNLASSLQTRHKHTQVVADLEEAVAHCRAAVRHVDSRTSYRVLAGHMLILLHFQLGSGDLEQLYQDSSLAVSLIPRLISSSLESSDMQGLLGNVVDLASMAGAVALEAGKDPLIALGLLESGRGIMAASLQEMRTDALDLRARYPLLEDRLSYLQKELSTPTTQDSSHLLLQSRAESTSWGARFDRRYGAGREFDALVDEIRQLPGFEGFLGPPSRSDIREAACHGPIAVINVSRLRCDAILVGREGQIQSLALPRLSYDDIERESDIENDGNLGRREILEWLWDAVACPVLNALAGLGFDQQAPQTASDKHTPPRMWWVATGLLSRFPLHAAGYHHAGNPTSETVIDRVMSSYSSSIKAIIHGRRRRQIIPPPTPSPVQALLLVAMPHTPGFRPLRHTTAEASQVHEICSSMSIQIIQPQQPHKQDILTSLPNCALFHFAGHGHADASNPSNSQLHLQDWQDSPLRVSDLLDVNLHAANAPFLAYLSACGTGRVEHKDYLDESIHLISACQLAGFRHVIGTLWDVDDECCVDVARMFYESIRDGGLTDELVCRGLHNASRALRDRWVEQGQDLGRRRNQDQQNPSPITSNPAVGHKRSSLVEQRPAGFGPPGSDVVAGGRAREIARDGWMWGLDSRSIQASLDAAKAGTRTRSYSGLNTSMRKIELLESDGCDGGKPLLWVPYVHFGV